jgi:hypothetical protein
MTAEAAHESVPVTDPVCGMTADPATAFEHRGTGVGCRVFLLEGIPDADVISSGIKLW